MEQVTIRDLCKRYLTDSLSAEELRELLDYLRTVPDAETFLEEMQEAVAGGSYPVTAEQGQQGLVFQRVLSIVRGEETERSISVGDDMERAVPMRKRTGLGWRSWMAAAVLILAVAGAWLLFYRSSDNKPTVGAASPVLSAITAPVGANAIITLANGDKIILDSAKNGEITQQGNSKLVKQADGGLAYEATTGGGTTAGAAAAIAYNTITVPRGSRTVRLTLADGTKVWLNAASSLYYPAVFRGGERRVAMTGEAYFEVASNNRMPFIVQKSNDPFEVQVLGTHFNVNAYDDEEKLKVTLLQGGVRLVKGAASAKLEPGQQGQLNKAGQITLIRSADTAAAVAWKNEFFSFHKAGLRDVMRQLSRWYDIDVSYEGDPSVQEFNGEIGRNLSLKDVLDGLAITSIHYRMEGGRRLIILP